MSAPCPARSAGPGPDGPAHRPQPLHQTVYCSLASEGVDEHTVARIVEKAHAANPGLGITGMLVFGGGVFFQWIEGPRAHIVPLMDRIRADPRHRQVVILSESEEVRERLFPDWDMELVTSAEIRDVLLDAMASAQDKKNVETLRLTLMRLGPPETPGLDGLRPPS
ncbi:MAG: hypothetical protein RLZ83_2058 [Pseudomonadota bacterium]